MKKIINIVIVSLVTFTFSCVSREDQWRSQCANSIRMIHEPMYCCVPMANGLTEGSPLTEQVIVPYIKGGKLPKCPSGAEYKIQWVVGEAPPICPYHGALVTKAQWEKEKEEQFKKQMQLEKESQQSSAP